MAGVVQKINFLFIIQHIITRMFQSSAEVPASNFRLKERVSEGL
jgi:hypothetical protein